MRLRLPATFAALRHRNYRLFFSGQLVSLIGTWMQSVAQAWLVFKLTGSALYLGLVAAAAQAPVLVLSLVGGVVADRIAKRRLLIVTQSFLALLALGLATLTALGVVRPWHVAVIAALAGINNAFDIPTRQAFVVEMVGQEDLMNAIALNSSVFHGARIIGPTIAGLLVASVGMAACFFLNSLSFLAVIVALAAMRLPQDDPGRRTSGGVWSNLTEGVRYVAHHRTVAGILTLVGTFSIFGLPYAVLLPVYAKDILHVGPEGLGMLFAASGAGAVVGALSLATFSRTRRRFRIMALGLLAFAVAVGAFGQSRLFPLSLALLVVSGWAALTFAASANTLVQSIVPDELRGRVMGMYSLVFLGLSPLGALQAGAVAQRLGAPVALGLGAAACAAVTCLVLLAVPALRRDPSPAPAAAPPEAPPAGPEQGPNGAPEPATYGAPATAASSAGTAPAATSAFAAPKQSDPGRQG